MKKNVTFAKIDAGTNANLIRQLNIKSFPTVFLFSKNGEIKEKYRGHWTMEAFKLWFNKNLKQRRSPSRLIDKHQVIFDKMREVTPFVMFFGTNASTPEFELYEKVAA